MGIFQNKVKRKFEIRRHFGIYPLLGQKLPEGKMKATCSEPVNKGYWSAHYKICLKTPETLSMSASEDKFPRFCTMQNCTHSSHWTGHVIGKGVAKTVYPARYCRGPKKNKKAVVKFYNDGFIFEEDFWSREIEAHKKAKEFANIWNESKLSKAKIIILVPEQEQYCEQGSVVNRTSGLGLA